MNMSQINEELRNCLDELKNRLDEEVRNRLNGIVNNLVNLIESHLLNSATIRSRVHIYLWYNIGNYINRIENDYNIDRNIFLENLETFVNFLTQLSEDISGSIEKYNELVNKMLPCRSIRNYKMLEIIMDLIFGFRSSIQYTDPNYSKCFLDVKNNIIGKTKKKEIPSNLVTVTKLKSIGFIIRSTSNIDKHLTIDGEKKIIYLYTIRDNNEYSLMCSKLLYINLHEIMDEIKTSYFILCKDEDDFELLRKTGVWYKQSYLDFTRLYHVEDNKIKTIYSDKLKKLHKLTRSLVIRLNNDIKNKKIKEPFQYYLFWFSIFFGLCTLIQTIYTIIIYHNR